MRFAAALRALPTTFVIYVIEALCAAFAALPSALELGRLGLPARWDKTSQALLLEGLLERAAVGRAALVSLGLALLVIVLLGPWLQMSWLAAVAAPRSVGSALAVGLVRSGRACAVSLLVALGGVCACLPFAALVYGTHLLLQEASVRTHDLGVAAAALPLALALPLVFVWHDLARARALNRRALASVRSGFRALGLGTALSALVLLGGGLLLSVSIAGLVGTLDLPRPLAVVVLQGAAFARLFLRSCWLARVVPDHAHALGEE